MVVTDKEAAELLSQIEAAPKSKRTVIELLHTSPAAKRWKMMAELRKWQRLQAEIDKLTR